MQSRHRIEDLIQAGWRILNGPGDDQESAQWKARALDCIERLFGPDHIYVSYLRESFGRSGRLSVLSGAGILDAAREQLNEPIPKSSGLMVLQQADTTRRIIVRIDFGPNFDEIRDSIKNGTVVTFGGTCGEELTGVVLDAKLDLESGRASLTVEEQKTSTVYFARYSRRDAGRSCGDLVTWRLRLNEIEDLRRIA